MGSVQSEYEKYPDELIDYKDKNDGFNKIKADLLNKILEAEHSARKFLEIYQDIENRVTVVSKVLDDWQINYLQKRVKTYSNRYNFQVCAIFLDFEIHEYDFDKTPMKTATDIRVRIDECKHALTLKTIEIECDYGIILHTYLQTMTKLSQFVNKAIDIFTSYNEEIASTTIEGTQTVIVTATKQDKILVIRVFPDIKLANNFVSVCIRLDRLNKMIYKSTDTNDIYYRVHISEEITKNGSLCRTIEMT